jgi:hypothetical protein
MDGNYTPLINAIIRGNIEEVRGLLETGADPNQRDNVRSFNWCPFKWIAFVNNYGNIYNDEEYDEAVTLLRNHGARTCYDNNHVRENSYNFSPVVTDIDELLEEIRREYEEGYYDDPDYYENVTNNTSGGRRRRKRKTQKRSKSQKRNNKKRRTRKRKHTKK